MSYILEALKKSQQERELGRVPTLDTSGMFAEDKEPVRPSHWGVIAVGLAAVAVAIAVYAVLRAPAPAPIPMQAGTGSGVSPAPVWSGSDPVQTVDHATAAIGSVDSQPAPLRPQPVQRASRPSESAQPAPGQSASIDPEPPLPRAVRTRQALPSEMLDEDPDIIEAEDEEMAFESEPEPEPEFNSEIDSEIDPWLEQELQRQIDAEQAMYPERPAPIRVRRPDRAQVPADLVDDIESFKEQLRRDQGIAPSVTHNQPVDLQGDPTKLRLTPQQQAQIPAYFMTVHVYDEDPTKRFVLINALRYGEGEETREGLRVERIIPEGAVLSYLGDPFFVQR